MPTEAVTGTRGSKAAKAKEAPPEPEFVGQPLADPNGNGTIQATAPDGSTINVDGSAEGWQDIVREQDPKHVALRHEAK